jgi:hypothetical protein
LTGPDSNVYVLGTQGNSTLNSFYISTDFGKTWNFNPITFNTSPLDIDKLNTGCWVDSNGIIFIAGVVNRGLIRSVDRGNSWQKISGNNSFSLACGKKGNIFIWTDSLAFHSSDDGLHWTPIHGLSDTLLANGGIFSVNPAGKVLFVGIEYHAVSNDNGISWTECKNNYPLIFFGKVIINTDADSGFYGSYYANYYDRNGTAFSNNPCSDWNQPLFPTANVDDLIAYSDEILFAGITITGKNVWQLKNSAIDWKSDTLLTQGTFVIDSQKNICSIGSTVYRSVDSGKTWGFLSYSSPVGSSVTWRSFIQMVLYLLQAIMVS